MKPPMTNDDIKNLALGLLRADSEAEVIQLLTECGFWTEPRAWRLVGDRDGNFATIGNQQSRPEAALVEKIVNAVDARLLNECLVRGIPPTSGDAPQTIRDAVAMFFENRDSIGELAGTIQGWSQSKQLEEAKFITLAVTGAMPSTGDPCITIVDQGEGQTPSCIPVTFLSIDRNNKLRIPFVQGKFNMGGTGALKFCGQQSLQLILTRRNPAIAPTGTNRDRLAGRWGFTVVRRERPGAGVGNVRNSVFRYLAPAASPAEPECPQVLSFDAESLPLMPERNRPYARSIEWGSAVKLFEYDMKGFRSHALMKGLLSRLELLLPSIALPVRVHECRPYRGVQARSFENTLVGMTARLDQNRGDNLEEGYPASVSLAVRGEPMTAQIYAFKADKAGSYRTNEGVVFVINGQMHAAIPKTFFGRSKVKMSRLADSLLVIVDCSRLSVAVREDLFMNSRDRLSNGDMRRAVEDELQRIIGEHSGLRELRESRRQQEVAARLHDSRPLEDVIRSILKSSPSLSKLFLLGQRLTHPHRGDRSGVDGSSGSGPDTGPGPFRGRKHPSFFRFYRKGEKELLVRRAEHGRRCRLRFETDVENDYFGRSALPGHYAIRVLTGPVASADLDHSLTLHNGVANWTLSWPEEALAVGDQLTIECSVRDDAMISPLLNVVRLDIVRRTDRPSDSGERNEGSGTGTHPGGGGRRGKADRTRSGDSAPAGIQMPDIVEVKENDENWHSHGFDSRTACSVIEDAEEDGGKQRSTYTFYVNVDNVCLLTEMKGASGDVALIRAKFIYGNVLVGLALIHDYRDRTGGNGRHDDDDGGEETVESRVARMTRAMSPFLVPMIDYLGALSSDDVANLGRVGDNE